MTRNTLLFSAKKLFFVLATVVCAHTAAWADHSIIASYDRESGGDQKAANSEWPPCDTLLSQPDMPAAFPLLDNAIDSILANQQDEEPPAETIADRIERLLEDPMFLRSQVAILVLDLDADTVLYDHGSRQLMRPASVMKVLTAVTALNNLGAAHQFSTRMYYSGEVSDSILHGDLYIKGGFDPLFDASDMKALVRALKEKEIFSIDGSIYADLSFKDTLKWGEGWCWDDKATTLTPLLYDAKDIFMTKFMQSLTSADIAHPANYSRRHADEDDMILLEQCSHTIQDMLTHMLKSSDNLFAESLFYQLGATNTDKKSKTKPSSARASAEKEYAFIRSLGLDPDHYTVADGSGLSLYNYLTPQLVVRLLRHAWHSPAILSALYPALPIAGQDGTLKNRMKHSPAAGNVHAKTGTLRKVSTLAGYATTAAGKHLAFCIFNQGILNAQEGRDFQDRVCQLLVR